MFNDNRFNSIAQSIFAHVFIFTAAFAALVHSTWSLSTGFGGIEPPQLTSAWWAWLLPGFALAFSFDVGQVATSTLIQRGNRSAFLYATFGVCAVATYYLQWLYIAIHLPTLPLSTAINPAMQSFAIGFRDLMPWILPALLPLSTFLYTFSYAKPKKPTAKTVTTVTQVKIETPVQNALQVTDVPQIEAGHAISCELCDWTATKDTKRGAQNALNAHKRWEHAK